MNKLEKIIAVLVTTILIVFFGCSAMQDSIFPCYIPPESITYADANVPLLAPWTTITDAEYIQTRMKYMFAKHAQYYGYLDSDLTTHLIRANEIKAVVFDPNGPLPYLISGMGFLALGTYGLSKPSDKKKIVELEKANGGLNNGKQTV